MKLFLIIILFTSSCSSTNVENLEIGAKLNEINFNNQGYYNIMDSKYNLQRCLVIDYKDLLYFIQINEEKEIILIITDDKGFKSPEGYKIGDHYSLIKYKGELINRYLDLFTFKLDSDWNAIVRTDTNNSMLLTDTSKIVWFEKRVK